MSLLLQRRENERSSQFGNTTLTTWSGNRSLYVVNSETLQPGGWMQPQVWASPTYPAGTSINIFFSGRDFPTRLVGSRNGAILNFRSHFAVITPRFSLMAPYPPPAGSGGGDIYQTERAEGSITGILASNANGMVFRNGMSESGAKRTVTPCGRYAFVGTEGSSGAGYEVRTVEGNRPLFRINRMAASQVNPGDFPGARSIQLLQDNGPALVQSGEGKVLQFISLDIPALARELSPENFHVTSQPMPILIEGGTYEYQIQTNNPNEITGYKLRETFSNATISPSGLLRFPAPPNVRDPVRVYISLEIMGKNGKSLVHEFSVIVISRTMPTTPLPVKPAAPPRQIIRSNSRLL